MFCLLMSRAARWWLHPGSPCHPRSENKVRLQQRHINPASKCHRDNFPSGWVWRFIWRLTGARYERERKTRNRWRESFSGRVLQMRRWPIKITNTVFTIYFLKRAIKIFVSLVIVFEQIKFPQFQNCVHDNGWCVLLCLGVGEKLPLSWTHH